MTGEILTYEQAQEREVFGRPVPVAFFAGQIERA
jgi:hypothetical protein